MSPKSVTIEGARIIFRNFEGKEGQYNAKGDRNFTVVIDDQRVAEQMMLDGWNVKVKEGREEGDPPEMHLSVAVSYKHRPPRIVTVTSSGRTNLDETTVEILDWADISNVDLIINAYEWDVNGKQGIKAYLKTMFVTIDEDDLERKYAVPQEEMHD